ncbi:MAG TPA: PepSY-like domain-containing protein [Bacteroidia bacterium]|nr:PepSY-like domain-containing protein [Bacteroidia bacterium]
MKLITLLLSMLLVNMAMYAQKVKAADVPLSVKEGLKKKFPGITVEKWEKEGVNFEAEFDLNKVETSALFDNNGNLIETESEINISELPQKAIEYLSEKYKDEKIKEASKITMANGQIKYEAEIKGKDILFDTEGIILK